jgi:hypothetical protein
MSEMATADPAKVTGRRAALFRVAAQKEIGTRMRR